MKKSSKAAAALLALTFTLTWTAGCADSPAPGSSLTDPPESDFSDSVSGLPNGSDSSESGESSSAPNDSDNGSSDSSSEGGSETGSETPPEESVTPEVPETPSEQSAPPENTETPSASYVSYIKCSGENVNLRSGAGTNFAVVGTAAKNTMYVVIGKSGDWYKTYYKNQTVYISSTYVSVFSLEKSKNDAVENVISEGYKEIGVPYVYGAVRLHDGYGNFLKGFTNMKFDCSSLVQYAFFEGAGVLLQTTTRTQVSQGSHVDREDLRRGDCIYFTNASRVNKTGIERIGHVAIYLGDGYILHTASDYARIEKMNSTRWGYYIEARRFV